jgi:hypothetical protein
MKTIEVMNLQSISGGGCSFTSDSSSYFIAYNPYYHHSVCRNQPWTAVFDTALVVTMYGVIAAAMPPESLPKMVFLGLAAASLGALGHDLDLYYSYTC